MTLNPETNQPAWESSEYRARMLRMLDWTDLPIRILPNEDLRLLYEAVERHMEKHRSLHVPISRRVEKERRPGRTNRLGWRWVVYTRLDGVSDWREEQVCPRRCDAVTAARRWTVLRWVDFVRRYGRASVRT